MLAIVRDTAHSSALPLVERLRLLRLVRVIRAAINLELLEHSPPQFVFREHPLDREFYDTFRSLG